MDKRKVVIAALALLLILGGSLLYNVIYKPQMRIIVTYNDVPPIIENILRGRITVYFRGYKVGEVSDVKLSEDQKHVLFYINIYYKDLKLPKNIAIILKTEDIYGARFLSISYPKNPSSELLSDGDVIKGTATYDRIDKYLVQELETGKLKILVDNLIDLTNFADKALKGDNTELINDIKKSGGDVGTILGNIREILDDPQVKRDIKSTISYSSKSLKDLNQIMENNRDEINETISKAPESIDKTVRNLESLNNNMPKVNRSILKVNETIREANSTISRTNVSLDITNCNLETINRKVPEIPPTLLTKADKALTKFDCMGTELIDLLNERFILFKFLLGKPGSSFQRCKLPNPDCSYGLESKSEDIHK